MGIFPDRNSIIRQVGAVLAEQHDEWSDTRRYLGLEALAASRRVGQQQSDTEEVTNPDLKTLSASQPSKHHTSGYTAHKDLTRRNSVHRAYPRGRDPRPQFGKPST